MKNTIFSKDALNKLLPKEMKNDYTAVKIITANCHNIILSILSKKSNEKLIIKILRQEYYNKNLYQKIFRIENASLLLPVQIFSDVSYVYFVYPHLKTLAEVLSTKSICYSTLCTLVSSIGNAVASLHEHNILHLDITPNNIFFDKEGHFYLGDFSSALPAKRLQVPFSKQYIRTGTTRCFAPAEYTDTSPVSFWNDCYNLALLIYILFHNGKFPEENILPSPAFAKLDSFLLNWRKCPSFIHSSMIKEFMAELEEILTVCSKESDCQNYNLQLSNDNKENYSWENTPECSIENHSFRETNILHILFPGKDKRPVPLYGLLIFCGFLFFFSLYHYLAQNSREKEKPVEVFSELNENPLIQTDTNPPYSSDIPILTATPDFSDTPKPTQTTATPKMKKKRILDISGKTYQKNSFLENSQKASVQILFANQCHLSSCHSFFPLSSLKELYLNDNQITSLKGIQKLSKLEILVLSKNKLTDISSLAKLPSLTALDLSHNSHLKGVSHLCTLKKLHYLVLTNTNITKKEVLFLQEKLPDCTIFY